MHWKTVCFLMISCMTGSKSLTCYNCSTTYREWGRCGGDFVHQTDPTFNTSMVYLVNCTGAFYDTVNLVDNAMCFVRVWSSRVQHSWLVQRGCYHPVGDDPLPQSLNIPTRAMACKHERFPEAEYKVCLCQADWCNSSTELVPIFPNLISVIGITLFLRFI